MTRPRTIIEKLWDAHVVSKAADAPALLYIDLHLVHEVTSPQAFDGLRQRGLKVRRPDLTIATCDHSTPTTPKSLPIVDADGESADRTAGRELQQSLAFRCSTTSATNRASCTSSVPKTASRSPA